MATTHRVLVVGGGSIGERHARCFLSTGRAEVSLCEVRAEVREALAGRYRLAGTFGDLDEALAQPFDAAVVATPAPLHVPMAARLAGAGVHLLIEKPLGTSFDGLAELHDVVRAKRLTVAVAYVYRSHPVLGAMRAALRDGRFGAPAQLVVTAGQHFPHYRPAYRDIYYRDRATGGGAIQDALTHLLNAGEWLVGPVTRLAADAAHQVLDGVDVEDTAHVIARHGPVLASYSLNQYQAPNEVTFTVVCERGTARCETHHSRWRWQTHPDQPWQDEPHPPLERDTLFVRQADAFFDAVEGRGPVPCSLAEGEQTLRVNLAALAAADSHTWKDVGG